MDRLSQPFSLSDAARRSLKQALGRGVHSTRELTRARILLRLDEGLGPSRIAHQVGVHPKTVINVLHRAQERGWHAAMEDRPRGNRFSGEARANIAALACSDPPQGHDRWSLRLLANKIIELGYAERISHETIRGILNKTGSSYT